jgi:ABC-type Fe3+-hydroxamate transport system substrate-binding protein
MNEPALAQLRNLGVPVLALRTDRLEDLARAARLLGQVTGETQAGDSVAAAVERAIADGEVLARSARRGPTVVILVWDSPPIAIGRSSYLHQIVQLAGGRNLFGDLPQSSVPVSLEAIAARNPEVILATGDVRAALIRRPEWQAVAAVREGRVLALDDPALARPGLRALTGIAPLRARLARLVTSSSLEIVR